MEDVDERVIFFFLEWNYAVLSRLKNIVFIPRTK